MRRNWDPGKISRIGRRVRTRIERREAGPNPYFYQLVNQYQDAILELKKPSTRDAWRRVYRLMMDEFGAVKVDKLDRKIVQMYFTGLSKKMGAASVQTHWVALSALLNYARREGIIEWFSKPELPKKYRNQQQWVNLEQMHALLDHSFGREHLFIMVLAETGCRMGEALGLQTQDINLAAKQMSVLRTIYRGKPNAPKTESSVRTFAISDELCQHFESLLYKSPRGYVFSVDGTHPWADYRARFHKLCDKAGVSRVGLHALRRGNITHLVSELGMPESIVGQRVGHLSEGMTLGVYVQRQSGLDKKWIGKIAEALYRRENAG